MHRLFALLLVAYALLIPCGDAFRLHRWLPIPLVVLLVAGLVVAPALAWRPRVPLTAGLFRRLDLALVAYVLALGISLLVSLRVEQKNINHFLGYTSVVGIYYFFVKFLCAADDTLRRHEPAIRAALAWSVFITAVYTVLEFADANGMRLGVASLVKFPGEEEPYDAWFALFIRARGFVMEPGFLALFFNTFVPISFAYVRRSLGRTAAWAFAGVCGLGFIATFSAAGLAFLGAGLLGAIGLYVGDRYVILLPLRTSLFVAAAVVAVVTVGLLIPSELWQPIGAKLTLGESSSVADRLDAWVAGAAVAAEHPVLGTGIGSTSLETGGGVLSFYLTMLKEGGVVALVSIVVFFVGVFRQIMALPRSNPYKYAYAASFIAAACHMAVITDIWYPWLWLLCVFIAAESAAAPAARWAGAGEAAV